MAQLLYGVMLSNESQLCTSCRLKATLLNWLKYS